MFCSKCGYELMDGTSFCRKCGSKIIYNNIVPDEKKSNLDLNTAKNTTSKKINSKQIKSKEISSNQIKSKETNTKHYKSKPFIILGILILLLSVGFGSYYISFSKFFSDNSKKSEKTTIKNKVIPSDTPTIKKPETKPTVAAPTTTNDISNMDSPDYYFFPKSQSEKLLDSDVSKLNKDNLALARNEIYARHGLVFKTEVFKNYFSNKTWYKPDPNFKQSDGGFTSEEAYNIQLISKHENN